MKTFLLRLLLLLLIFTAIPAAAQSRKGKAAVERQRREAAAALKQSADRLEGNRRTTAQRLAELSAITAEIAELDRSIKSIAGEIEHLDTTIAAVEDTITALDNRITLMSEKYGAALRASQRNRAAMSELAFVFASDEFGQMWRRYRNIRQFAQWRARKAEEIKAARLQLEERRAALEKIKVERQQKITRLNADKETLVGRRKENDRLVAQLRKEQKQIRAIMSQKQKEINSLDRELDRLIAQEQNSSSAKPLGSTDKNSGNASTASKSAAPAEEIVVERTGVKGEATTSRSAAQLSDAFRKSRGQLIWPADGKLRVISRFGRHKHPSLPMVEIDNPGVDIGLTSGNRAVAVFEGVVSAVFRQPGYNNIVMLRHGDYITVYANLETISVGKGERVGLGHVLGTIAPDEDNPSMRVLHFEIRREKTKENPESWLK